MILNYVYINLLLANIISALFVGSSTTIILSICSTALAYSLGFVSLVGVGSLILTGSCFYFYYHFISSRFLRIIAGLILTGIILGYYMHLIPGFQNLVFIDSLKITPDAAAYRKYINLDKIMLSIFIVLSSGTILKVKRNWTSIAYNVIIYLIPAALILIGGLYITGYARFCPKLPELLWTWAPLNLLMVCFSEEVALRGFLLKEMEGWFNSKSTALVLSSLFFGALHYPGGPMLMGLAAIASLFYGHIYQKTNRLEASIFLHFLINTLHMIFFTYPCVSR